MKKYIYLPLILLLFCGCSINKVEEESFDSIINTVLYKDTNLFNVSFEGYKFYLPRGAQISEQHDYNLEVKDSNVFYYLYIDTIESSQFERNEYFVLELDTNNQIFNIAPYNGEIFK